MSNTYKDILPQHYVAFPKSELEGNIVERFRKIVSLHHEQPAIKHNGAAIAYGELELASNALASLLLSRIGPAREPVVMMFKHGIGAHVAQLAVLKSGKFYAHIDCDLNFERQTLILGNLEARVLLCDDACENKARWLASAFPAVTVLNTGQVDVAAAEELAEVNIGPKDYAHIVYTSGSTGPPQGVVVSHENVLQITCNHTNYMHIRSDDRATAICPLSTAASGAEIFAMLLNGATLFPYSVSDQGLVQLTKLFIDEKITLFTAVPTLFRMLMRVAPQDEKFPAMRLIKLAGDRTTRVEVELFRQHFTPRCLLRLGLGSSEVLMFVHFYIDSEYSMTDEIAPAGYPLDGIEVLLVDDDLNEIRTVGECGEIVVRSTYLSVGYWNNPELTRERFLADSAGGDKGMYLTRDIGYFDDQGRLHHVGRKDARVKIYGKMYLISDVEEALLGIRGVTEAIVVPFDSGERGTELAAYIVTEPGCADLPTIRQQLAEKVVAEARPRTITVLDSMPLQMNNKINRLELRHFTTSLQAKG
jgi:acyl-coenzyme A synthetase/AMP-(fatty) acid ligase